MIDEVIENKTDNDLLSSRLGSQVSTTRPIYHLGWAPIYISPKILQDQGNSYDTKISTQNKMNITPVVENSSHGILTDRKQSFHEKVPSAKMTSGSQQKIIFKKLNHIGLNAIDSLIYTAFLLGSFNIFEQFVFIDYAGNVLCAVKIILYHLLIFIHNSKVKFEENQQNQMKQPKKFYINRLQLYQLMQIWSICCTICMLIARNNPFIHNIINSIRLIRLFFIFFMHRKKQDKWRAKVFFHILKITIQILVCTLLIAIGMELLLYNIENYFCLQSTELTAINLGIFPPQGASACGLSKNCPVTSDCKNIFSYTENQEQKRGIEVFLQSKSGPYSQNLLVRMLAVLSIGNTYHKYKYFVMQWLLLPLVAIIWLIFLTFTGIGIGESIRYQSMQNWSRSLETQRKMQLKLKRKGKKRTKTKRRSSNITFNSNKLIQPQQYAVQSPQVVQFSKQINDISQQLMQRSIKQKTFTVLFNLASLTQVCFIIVQNLNLSPWINTVSGVSLGVIFILWSFGLAFALYGRISNPQQNKRNRYQAYILIYEILAYSLTISDYLMRIILNKYLFESSTEITPFSQAAISLRVVYVLFNNGFDAHISYFAEKMIQNLINNKTVIGFMIIFGSSIGFILHYNFQYFQKYNQIALVSTAISIGYGANGGIPTENLMLCSISLLLASIGIIINFYLAKHVNIGYDSILCIDFSQQTMQIPNKQSEQKISNEQQGCFIKALKNILEYHFYYKTKGLIVAGYVILALVYQQPTQSQSVEIIKFCIDIYFIADIIAQFIAYGLCKPNSYLWSDAIPKSVYIGSQIFLFVTFFVPNIEKAFINSLRVSRGFILFGCIPELHQIYLLIKSILFHPKIKIYKIIILSIPLMLVGMCLSSPYLDDPNTENSTKFLNMIGFSTSFIYNLGWSFVGKKNPLTLSYLCLDLIFACLVLFLHVILTFMMVTYFVNRKVKMQGDICQQILRQYETTDPQYYHCELANDRKIYAYLKILKIVIICISTALLGMLSGGWLEYSDKRTFVAVLNLFFCFVQIMIYVIQNMFIKEGMQRWSIPQICILGLSLPGSFFIAFPVIRFSHNTELNLIVRVFLLFSMLRLLRIFNLFANRSVKLLSSLFLRRISKELYVQQALGIFLFVVIAILPFSTFQANISHSECPEQFIKYLTGSIFPNEDIKLIQLIPKIICTWCVLFPIRTMLLARVISSFLSNKPNELLFLRDKIANEISQSQLILTLNQQLITKQTFFLPYNKIYIFSARIERVFRQFWFQKKLKCLNFQDIMKKISKMNIPLYKFTNNEQKIYGVLLYDVIWNFYQDYKRNEGQRVEELATLFGKAKHKKENIGKTHFGTHQLLAYLKIQKNFYRKIKEVRINMLKKCQE